ncbi:MAG: phospholipid carrier-dependent glycosyltransferase, partial [Candidatus Omnitrophica bacterium]|nr:phospholipid carrier-dependent glycosyltransferase [Candidatus Omnitrophota bacterium]
RLFDRKTGLAAAGILATTLIFFMYSRYASPDMTLTFLVVYSIYLFMKGSKNPERNKGFFIAFFAVLGLAIMAKGLVGFLLPLIVVLSFMISSKKWKLLRALNIPYGMLIVLAIGLPWYIMMYVLHGDKYINNIVIRENITRLFYLPNSEPGTPLLLTYIKNLFYYVPNLLVWFLPYCIFLPAALVDSFKSKKTYSLERDSYKLILSYFLGIFVFFSVISAKEYYYLLPLTPAFSLMIARYFINLEERKTLFKSVAFNIGYVAVILVYTLGVFGVLYTMRHIYAARVSAYEYVMMLAPLVIIVPWVRKKSISMIFAIPVAIALFLLFLAGRAVPLFNDKTLPAFADEIKMSIVPGDKVGVGSVDISQQRLAIYLDMPIEEVNIKLKEPDPTAPHKEKLKKFLSSGNKVYLVIAQDDYAALIPEDLKRSLVIIDERDMWKTRLKRTLNKDAIAEVLKGKKDILKDVLRHKVFLLTNKKI